jgi:hypothetical protein
MPANSHSPLDLNRVLRSARMLNVAHAVSIHPTAAITTRRDIFKIADDLIALILLQILISDFRVTRLCAGIDAIKQFWLLVEVVAQPLKMLIPIWEFDDEFNLWIDRLRRLNDQVFRDVIHQIEAELRPTPVSLGGDVSIILRGVEKEIVLDQLVKVTRGEFRRTLDERAVSAVSVAKSLELAADAAIGRRHATGDLHAVINEKFLHPFQRFIARQIMVALDFDIDLVHFQLVADALPLIAQNCRVIQIADNTDGNINRDCKVRVLSGACNNGKNQDGG